MTANYFLFDMYSIKKNFVIESLHICAMLIVLLIFFAFIQLPDGWDIFFVYLTCR